MSSLSNIALYKAMRRHIKLSEKRAINYEQNKVAKYMIGIVGGLIIGYLIMIAVLLSLAVNESTHITSLEFICAISPFILTLDFLVRFVAQQTPAQLVKPYLLLPISRYTCINNFIVSSLLSSGNLTWFALLLPYTLMSVVFSYGLWSSLLMLVFYWILIMANSQWYAIVRTLINDSVAFWLIPAVAYAAVFSPWYLGAGADIGELLAFYGRPGCLLETGNPLPLLLALAGLAVVAFINRQVQYTHIMNELSRNTRTTSEHRIIKVSFLDKYGEIGQYLQLEIKTILRNKNPRKSFIFATVAVLLMSLLIAFTDVYDTSFYTNFWCLYDFVVYGSMMLVRIMCNEGNYIDGLMVRRENILSLFKAKYIFYCTMLLLPLLLMLPTVFSGKWSLLMLVSYAVFTAGFQYFILFQMAVYNKQTVPLNTKFISKNGMENNYVQVVAELFCLLVPVLLVSVLQTLLSENVTYIVMFAIGLTFIATHRLWLRNIYNRMMQRRYANMESFRASR